MNQGTSDAVSRQAAAQPHAPAVILDEGTISWRDLDARVEDAARRLATLRVCASDRVAVTLEPSLEAAEILFAAPRVGASLILLPADAPGIQIEMMTAQADPKVSITAADLAEVRPAKSYERTSLRDDDPRLIVFTSGTEGLPHGIVLSEGNLTASAHASTGALRLLPGDRWLACMPMHHVAGPSIFLRAAETGLAVAPLRVFDPALVMDALERTGATALSLVPTMLARLIDAGWRGNPSLRFVLLGGGPCSQPLLNAALDRGIPIASTYGLTEASSQVTLLPPSETRTHLGSAGRSLPGTGICVAEHPERPMPQGTPGPIWVKGPTVATHGLDGPLQLEAGWLATGDLGQVDSEGFLTVVGRIDDVILTGGEKVVPREIEDALASHPSVGETVVVGVPDDEWGQRAVAAVVVREGAPALDADQVRSFLNERLLRHKVPRSIVVLEDLPRTGPGKVDRRALRELLAKETRDG